MRVSKGWFNLIKELPHWKDYMEISRLLFVRNDDYTTKFHHLEKQLYDRATLESWFKENETLYYKYSIDLIVRLGDGFRGFMIADDKQLLEVMDKSRDKNYYLVFVNAMKSEIEQERVTRERLDSYNLSHAGFDTRIICIILACICCTVLIVSITLFALHRILE